jgi:hypothetical protein
MGGGKQGSRRAEDLKALGRIAKKSDLGSSETEKAAERTVGYLTNKFVFSALLGGAAAGGAGAATAGIQDVTESAKQIGIGATIYLGVGSAISAVLNRPGFVRLLQQAAEGNKIAGTRVVRSLVNTGNWTLEQDEDGRQVLTEVSPEAQQMAEEFKQAQAQPAAQFGFR